MRWMISLVLAVGVAMIFAQTLPTSGDEPVDFITQVQPILAEYCYECHGPDEDNREAELRLDRKESAFVDFGGYRNIVPGDPDDSELYLRVSAEFAEERMPPYDAGTTLSEEQIELIREWIEQGAEWPDDAAPSAKGSES